MQIKIAIFHSLYSPNIIGGAEISTQILAETLNSHYTVNVVTVGQQSRDVGMIKENINKVTVNRLPYNNIYWMADNKEKSVLGKVVWRLIDTYNPLQYFAVKNFLKEFKPDIIHTQNLSGLSLSVWKAAKELNIPIVHTLRDYSLLSPMPSYEVFSKYYQIIARHYSKHVTSVIGISNCVLDRHIEKKLFASADRYVIPNVVQDDGLPFKKKESKGPLKLGYFGQLTPHKGVGNLISAVKNLGRDIVEKLYICGDGPMKDELKELSLNDDRIVFTGKLTQNETKQRMRDVDLTIFPSIWEEPFGRVIIESYQVGTPVIASKIGGIPDVIVNEEYLFERDNDDAITKAILSFVNKTDLEREMIQEECYLYSKKFNTEMLFNEHVKVYNSILNR